VQEEPVQDEDRPGSRVLLGRFHRQVDGQVVRGRPVATVAARTERLQNPLVQRAQVVAVEPEGLWRSAPSPVAHGPRVVEGVGRDSHDVAPAVAQLRAAS
jgi:hypothetical protein